MHSARTDRDRRHGGSGVRGWLYAPLPDIVKCSRDAGRLSEWSGVSMVDVSVSEVSDCGQGKCERGMGLRSYRSQPRCKVRKFGGKCWMACSWSTVRSGRRRSVSVGRVNIKP